MLTTIRSQAQFRYLRDQLGRKERGEDTAVSGSIEDLRRTLSGVDYASLPGKVTKTPGKAKTNSQAVPVEKVVEKVVASGIEIRKKRQSSFSINNGLGDGVRLIYNAALDEVRVTVMHGDGKDTHLVWDRCAWPVVRAWFDGIGA